jgi:hypothetical protein
MGASKQKEEYSPWQFCRWEHHSADGWSGVAPGLYSPLGWKFGTIRRRGKTITLESGKQRKEYHHNYSIAISSGCLISSVESSRIPFYHCNYNPSPSPHRLPSGFLQWPLYFSFLSLWPILPCSIESNYLKTLRQPHFSCVQNPPKTFSLAQSKS